MEALIEQRQIRYTISCISFGVILFLFERRNSSPNIYVIFTTFYCLSIKQALRIHLRSVYVGPIAAGLSPFNVESVAFEAGRIMLQRIQQLMEATEDFAFETTLSTRSYASLIKKVKTKGYKITLLYFWLYSPDFAKQRVAKRVSKLLHRVQK